MMRCVVYVAGRIVKYRDGSRKQCEQYLLAVVDGLEAAGCRLALEEHQGMWHGYTTFGKPVLAFVWNPNRRNA